MPRIRNIETQKSQIDPHGSEFVIVNCDCCGAAPGEPFLAKFGGFYTKCERCGFIFSNPRAKDPAVYNEFNNEQKSGNYISKHYTPRHQRIFGSYLRQLAPYKKTKRILEIGCSAGGFLYKARLLGWQPTGIEPVEMVARHGRDAHGLDVRVCALEDAELEPGTFDAVFTNAVLEHLPSPKGALTKMRELLRPGGAILAVTVNYESYTREFVGAEWKLIDPRAHMSLFSPATLRSLCEQVGLKVAKIATTGARFRPEGAKRLRGAQRWVEELRKFPYSIASRLNLRGDSISVLAERPENG